jgi:CheY-like chemotaxis protein
MQSLAIINQLVKQPHNGCLQMSSSSMSWSIYLEEGQLIYASYSENMLEVLYKKLQQLSRQISSIYGDIYKRLLARFETALEHQEIPNLDYLAICWLVNEKFISHIQAGMLIEQVAIEVMQSLLQVEEGYYEFTTKSSLDDMPKFCHLDISSVIVKCEKYEDDDEDDDENHPVEAQNVGILVNAENKTTNGKSLQSTTATSTEASYLQANGKSLAVSSVTKIDTELSQKLFQLPDDKKIYKIVCIDDSPTVLNSIKSFLDEEFFSVIAIKDPLKALMQIIRTKPDLILLDITMPNLDGYELCSLLRKHSYLKNIPVIMVTGRSGFIDRAKAKMVRSSGYLTKPFNQGELLKVVFQHIR